MVLIVCIATGDYFKYLDGFVESLSNFMPGIEKVISIYTDNLELKYDFSNMSDDILSYHFHHIVDMPWPIIALEKFRIIEESIRSWSICGDITHVYMWDITVRFRKAIPSKLYMNDKMIGILHYAWDYEKGNDKALNQTEEWSMGYVNCKQYPYVCSGTIAGPKSLILDMCDKCMTWMREDLLKRRIPRHDDESYFTRFFTQLPEESKLILPCDFDFASDPTWCDDQCNDPYICSVNDDTVQDDKWRSHPDPCPELPEIEYHPGSYYMNKIKELL